MSRANGQASSVYSGLDKTMPGYVETDEGMIAHIEVIHDGGVLHAPVCIQTGKKGQPPGIARNAAGRALYALPGGRRVAG